MLNKLESLKISIIFIQYGRYLHSNAKSVTGLGKILKNIPETSRSGSREKCYDFRFNCQCSNDLDSKNEGEGVCQDQTLRLHLICKMRYYSPPTKHVK